mgnify:CR=1 FL=1
MFFFFTEKAASDISACLVGSEMLIGDSRILSVDRFVNALEPDLATMANYDTGMVSAVLSAQLNPGRNRYTSDIFHRNSRVSR